MILKKFYWAIIIRVVLLALTGFLFACSFLNPNNLFTILVTASLFIVQTIFLIVYINRINSDLERFLFALQNEDSTVSYTLSSKKGIYRNLKVILDEINRSISKVKIEKENQFQYLQYVIEHVNVGLIAFNSEGKISLLNQAARNIFNSAVIRNISELNRFHPGIQNTLISLKPSEQRLVMVPSGNNILQLALRKSQFKLAGEMTNLVSFQNIQTELDHKELESWQKLIRVLRHEIMNTVSPITSLTTTLTRIFTKRKRPKKLEEITANNITDTLSGLEIISKRSQGILDFVEQYKKLTQLPKPDFKTIKLCHILEDITVLLQNDLDKSGIRISVHCSEDLQIFADRKLIEQVLINLIKNSTEALKDSKHPKILLKAFNDREGRTTIQVADNGIGIPDDIRENIFVPFYSTKENGTGIGLSLVRQIILLHKGNIMVQSVPGKETVFSLVF